MVGLYRKGYRSKSSRVLSTRRIFSRKGRSQQASQIYALKKKLFSYIKRTRPETIIQQHVSNTTLFPSSEVATGGAISTLSWQYRDTSAGSDISRDYIEPVLGTVQSVEGGDPNLMIKNDFARLYNVLIEGVMRYKDNGSSNPPVTIRLVIVQTKTTRAQDLYPNDIFRRSIHSTDDDSAQGNAIAVYGPLQTGVSSTCAILFDRLFTINTRLPSRKISISLKKLINYRRDSQSYASGSSETIPKGRIYVFCARTISPDDTAGSSQTQLILNAKIAYPDN